VVRSGTDDPLLHISSGVEGWRALRSVVTIAVHSSGHTRQIRRARGSL